MISNQSGRDIKTGIIKEVDFVKTILCLERPDNAGIAYIYWKIRT